MPVTIGKKYISSGYNGAITAVNGKTGAVALTPSDIGLDNVTNDAQIKRSEMGIANGVALLDINGKLINTQLPESIIGAVNYRGIWNANTNTPEIPISSINNKGYYYVVSVLGTTEIDSIVSWAVGDWIISDGLTWSKITTTQSVSSVVGKTGAVTLVKGDVGLGNVQNVNQTNADNLTSGTVNSARLPVMGASGVNHSAGIVPDTGEILGTTKFLREDGSWSTPAGGIAGANGQIQFNDNDSSGADSNLTWDNINKRLEIKGLTNDGSTDIINAKDSDGTSVFSVDTDGNIDTSGDHASSGYFDIGTMRIQWGIVGTSAGAKTVTLPALFANTSYSVTTNILDNSTSWIFSCVISNQTTSSFIGTVMYGNYNTTDIASQGFNWIAVGLKP